MVRYPSFAPPTLALALFLGVATLGGEAGAGELQVRDVTHVLSEGDVGRLRSTVSALPFDARLAVTSDYADLPDLARYAHSLVSEPDMIVVALDPQHHHVEVRFGTGARVPADLRPQIERAGNEAFKHGDWVGGASRIFDAAAESMKDASGNPIPGSPSGAPQRPSLLVPVVLGLAITGILVFAFLSSRRRYTDRMYGGGGYGPQGPYAGGYPVAPPGGGMGPVGGGLIGAGLGGIAGYEIGKMEGEREERDRDQASDHDRGGGSSSSGSGDFDSGGGGSSWDGGGDSGGGGFDGGGGDSGGGGDF